MPFGWKNAGATFQRLMDKVFKDQIERNIEVYVYDILVKSTKTENHWRDLEETFSKIRKAGIKLKPEKCTFGVLEGKFLGYLISKEGIKPHHEKVEAITNMKPPKTLKELQKLTQRKDRSSRKIHPKN